MDVIDENHKLGIMNSLLPQTAFSHVKIRGKAQGKRPLFTDFTRNFICYIVIIYFNMYVICQKLNVLLIIEVFIISIGFSSTCMHCIIKSVFSSTCLCYLVCFLIQTSALRCLISAFIMCIEIVYYAWKKR